MTIYTVAQAMRVAQADARCGDIRASIELAVRKAAKERGAVFYSDVGPTGGWNVFGDCYDWAEVNPTVTIEI